jgi:GTPase
MKELPLSSFLDTPVLKEKKVGYVALIGRPNTGKSTFLNTLLEEKVSIVSSVPQTTRKRIFGIYNDEDSQIIFLDTPGIHESQKQFNQSINSVSMSSFADAQVILYFIDLSRDRGEEEEYIEKVLS